MKRIAVVVLSITVVVALVFGATIALAAKPQNSDSGKDVIALSNGFPSGEHFNLNIHGKKADFVGDSTPGGKSVFILEYGNSTIQYVSNKKASLTELTVLDPLAEAFDGDPAKVQLPYEPDGYYVFARILGKPNNGQNGQEAPASSIILYPNAVVGAWKDTNSDPDFGDYNGEEDESPLPLGLIVGPNVYVVDPVTETYVRFDPGTTTKGKGKSKATDITRLFTYTGWVVDGSLDIFPPAVGETPAGDGVIDINDVPLGDYDSDALTPDDHDYDNDGDEDADDVEAWLTDMSLLDPPMAWYFENEWILNIADLVITEQGLVNDGTKLLQVRFYPVDTTNFTPQ